MAWIQVHQSLFTHRKTLALASELGVERNTAAGTLIHLWSWCLDNTPDGDLSGLSDDVIAFGAEWIGDPGRFVSALVRAGYIDQDADDGQMVLHDWESYAGRLVEKRRENTERMRRARAHTEQDDPQPPGSTNITRATNVQHTCNERAGAREEKSREDDTREEKSREDDGIRYQDSSSFSRTRETAAAVAVSGDPGSEDRETGPPSEQLQVFRRIAALAGIEGHPPSERALQSVLEVYWGRIEATEMVAQAELWWDKCGQSRPVRGRATSFASWLGRLRLPQDNVIPYPAPSSDPSPADDPPEEALPDSGVPEWNAVLTHLAEHVPRPVMDEWFAPLEARFYDDELTLRCPSEFHRDWLEKKWRRRLELALNETGHGGISVRLETRGDRTIREVG